MFCGEFFLMKLIKEGVIYSVFGHGYSSNVARDNVHKRLPLHKFLSVPAQGIIFSHGAMTADVARQSAVEVDERLQLLNQFPERKAKHLCIRGK